MPSLVTVGGMLDVTADSRERTFLPSTLVPAVRGPRLRIHLREQPEAEWCPALTPSTTTITSVTRVSSQALAPCTPSIPRTEGCASGRERYSHAEGTDRVP